MNNTPGTKTLRKAAMRLLDVMLEAELGWWKGGPERDEQQKRSIDAQMVIADIAAENAAHITSCRPARFVVRREHQKMHPSVFVIARKLCEDLKEIEFADYPGGAKAAELHEVIGRIGSLYAQREKASVEAIREVCARAKPLLNDLPPSTKAKLAAFVLRIDDRNNDTQVQLPWLP